MRKILCVIPMIISFVLTGCTGEKVMSQSTQTDSILPLVENLNENWEFYRAEEGASVNLEQLQGVGWERVSLPHTTKIEPLVVTDQWQGEAFYRKLITVQPQWQGKKITIRFEGAMNVADVWLNGQFVGKHLGGYLPFVVDISGFLNFAGDNELLVKLNNRDNAITGPKPLKILDFSMYGGLYRGVSLTVKELLHISDEILADEIGGGGVFVSYPEVNAEHATITVQTHVVNDGDHEQFFTLKQSLLHAGKTIVESTTTTISIAAGSSKHEVQLLSVVSPALWSPAQPELYQLITTVSSQDISTDSVTTQIGIRRFEFIDNQLFINGQKHFLRGVNRHQEYPYVGYALSAQADYRDAKLIKEAGFDYVRLSHYPHSSHFMQAADELGLLLLDAVPSWQYYNEDPAFEAQVIQTCRDMLRRDRNHPSVLAWECSLNESQMPDSLIEDFHLAVHEEYPGDQAFSAGWVPQIYDIYLQARQHKSPGQAFPDKPYIVSEYGDWEYYAQNAGLAQDNWDNLKEDDRTSRQLLEHGEKRLLQQALNLQEAHDDNFTTPAVADGYWVMFDYNRGYSPDLEASGIMSIDRLPKYSYYFYKSQRSPAELSEKYQSGPMVFIASEWSETSELNVRVFSNAEEVELFLNGKSVGRQRPDTSSFTENLAHPPFTFKLANFEAGSLDAVAIIDDLEVARHQVKTPVSPFELVLTLADEGVSLQQGDLLFMRAYIKDRNGSTVPLTGERIIFTGSEGVEIVSPVGVDTRAGIASILVRIDELSENTSIKAEGLTFSVEKFINAL